MSVFKNKLFAFGAEQLKRMMVYKFLFALEKLLALLQVNCVAFAAYAFLCPDSKFAKYAHDVSVVTIIDVNGVLIPRVILYAIVFVAFLLYLATVVSMPGTLRYVCNSYLRCGLVKVSAIYGLLFNYILIVPMQVSIVKVYTCEGFEKCFSVEHLVWLVITIPVQILLIVLAVVSSVVNREDNPESHLLWASYDNLLTFFRFFFQFLAATFLVVGKRWEIHEIFSLVLALLALIGLGLRWRTNGEHRTWVDSISAFQDTFTFAVHTAVFVYYLTKSYEEIVQAGGLAALPITYVYVLLKWWSEGKIVKEMLPHQQKSVADVETYIRKFLKFLNKPEDDENFMGMTSVLILHSRECEVVNCVCIGLSKCTGKIETNGHGHGLGQVIKKNKRKSLLGAFLKGHSAMKSEWEDFLVMLVKEAVGKFPKAPELHLQLSYLYLQRLSNCYMALHSLQSAAAANPSILVKFYLFRQMMSIESALRSSLEERASSMRQYALNIERNLYYMEQFNSFQDDAEDCITEHQQFWEVVQEAEPDINRLHRFGMRISNRINKIQIAYKNIMGISPNNSSFLYKYALFLKHVIHDDIETHSILNKLKTSTRILIRNYAKWNCWEDKVGLIKASGDWKSLGQIKDASVQCQRLLKYTKQDLLSLNCTELMPPPMAKQHNKWVCRFYETAEATIMGVGRRFYVKKKNGYYGLFEVLLSPVPRLNSGVLEFALFFKKSREYSEIPNYLLHNNVKPIIFLCENNLNVVGVNKAGKQCFSLPSIATGFGKRECSIAGLLSQYVSIESLTKSREGAKFTLPVSKVSQKILGDLLDNEIAEEQKSEANLKEDAVRFWGRIAEVSYGESTDAVVRMKLCLLIPLHSEEQEKTTICSKCPPAEKNQAPRSPHDVSESVNTVTSSNSTARGIKEFKLNLYEKKYPTTVIRLKQYLVILGLLLFAVECKFDNNASDHLHHCDGEEGSVGGQLQVCGQHQLSVLPAEQGHVRG